MSIGKLTNHTVRFEDGVEKKVVAVHAAGKHIRYTFEDGSVMLNIHNLIADGKMEVLRRRHHNQTPVFSDVEDALDVAPEFVEEEPEPDPEILRDDAGWSDED